MKLKHETLENLFGWSFLAGFCFYLAASLLLMNVAETYFGISGRLIVGVLALLGFFFVFMPYFYRINNMMDIRSRAEAREKHRGIYRVLSPPAINKKNGNNWCVGEITIGDFGWESKPLTKDGLIWLHGLSTGWGHVWRAGFRPDQLEYVGSKPVSQYDWKDFAYDGPKATCVYDCPFVKPKHLCPFPVQKTIPDQRLKFLKFPVTCA